MYVTQNLYFSSLPTALAQIREKSNTEMKRAQNKRDSEDMLLSMGSFSVTVLGRTNIYSSETISCLFTQAF